MSDGMKWIRHKRQEVNGPVHEDERNTIWHLLVFHPIHNQFGTRIAKLA
jgi:hypothetical protein